MDPVLLSINMKLQTQHNPLLAAHTCIAPKYRGMQGSGLEKVKCSVHALYTALLFPAISCRIVGGDLDYRGLAKRRLTVLSNIVSSFLFFSFLVCHFVSGL